MSYDVYLVSKKCPTCGHDGPEPDTLNPTYNLTPIFDLALTGEDYPSRETSEFEAVVLNKKTDRPRGLRVLDGKTAEESQPILTAALKRMRDPAMRERFLALEPENGWGDLPGAIEVITKMLHNTVEYPDNTWEIR